MPNSPYSKGPKHHHFRTKVKPTSLKITTPSGKYCSRSFKRGYCPYLDEYYPYRADGRVFCKKYDDTFLLNLYGKILWFNQKVKCCSACLEDTERKKKKNA
jgi:hypothetical protein